MQSEATLLTGNALLRVPWSPVHRCSKGSIAPAARSAMGHNDALPFIHEVREDFVCVDVAHDGAKRNQNSGAGSVASMLVPAGARLA